MVREIGYGKYWLPNSILWHKTKAVRKNGDDAVLVFEESGGGMNCFELSGSKDWTKRSWRWREK